MKFKIVLLLTVALGSTLSYAEKSVWREKMRKISTIMSDIVPDLYPTADRDPKGLFEKVSKLRTAVNQLDIKKDHMIKSRDFDPGLIFFASALKENIDQAYQSMKEGYPDYARYMLKSSAAACIGCHSRTSSGAQFPVARAFEDSLKSAPWITKMEFLAANRQVDAAYDEIIKELEKPATQPISAFDLEHGSRLGLTIAVRVKQSPEQALKLTYAIKNSQHAPPHMKKTADRWQRDILSWQEKKPKKYTSAPEMIKDAKALIESAQQSGQDVEVRYLRASALLHSLLHTFPDSESPEVLYFLGLSYNRMQDIGLWDLQEIYFQTCILQTPHSDLAEKCYREFEKSVILGYSGSSGIHVPPVIQLKLNRLKEIAEKSKEVL